MSKNKAIKFCEYADRRATALEECGRVSTATKYRQTWRRWLHDMNDIRLDRLNAEALEIWIGKMKQSGLAPNSVDFYYREARAIYNRAIIDGVIDPARNPFNAVRTRTEPTAKRALSLEQLKALTEIQLEGTANVARDVFMLSFYLRGIPPVDLMRARKKDVSNGVLSYRRAKTSQKLSVRIEKEAAEIIRRYSTSNADSPMLLELPSHYAITYHLRRIGDMLRFPFHLTLYCARHTWATMARAHDVPLSVISAGLGHNNEQTTMIYLKSIDSDRIDGWNRKLLNELSL